MHWTTKLRLKSSVFWTVTTRSVQNVNWRLGQMCRLHFQGWRVSQARHQHKADSKEKWRQYVPPKCQMTFNRLHGIIYQKTELFITTAVRTSNPTILILLFYAIHIFTSATHISAPTCDICYQSTRSQRFQHSLNWKKQAITGPYWENPKIIGYFI
jgi:hypothetical protein